MKTTAIVYVVQLYMIIWHVYKHCIVTSFVSKQCVNIGLYSYGPLIEIRVIRVYEWFRWIVNIEWLRVELWILIEIDC